MRSSETSHMCEFRSTDPDNVSVTLSRWRRRAPVAIHDCPERQQSTTSPVQESPIFELDIEPARTMAKKVS
jgi:hypothetical protein